MDPSICTTCGTEWFSHQKLHRRINVLENQQGILNEELLRVRHINQLYELRVRSLQHEQEKYAALAESSKKAAASLQTHLDSQRATIETDRREYALVIQSLEHESARREETERSLEHERAIVHKMTAILNKLELPNGESLGMDFLETTGLGTLCCEWKSTKLEVKSLRNELQCTAAELQ